MGRVIEFVDTSNFDESIEKVSNYIEQEEHEAEKLSASPSFNLVWLARKYDDWFLDPLVGFIIPGVGDIISSAATLPAVYVALFKIRSIKLTIAILATMAIDLAVGIVPFAGDIIDAFYKSSKIASRLIVGYVENDPDTMSEINRRAIWGTVGAIIIGAIIWLMYNAVISLYHWIVGLF